MSARLQANITQGRHIGPPLQTNKIAVKNLGAAFKLSHPGLQFPHPLAGNKQKSMEAV